MTADLPPDPYDAEGYDEFDDHAAPALDLPPDAAERLAEVLATVCWPSGEPMIALAQQHRATVATALLPTVAQLVADDRAEELERAALEQDAEVARVRAGFGSHRAGHECAAGMLRDRAAAIRQGGQA